MKLPAETDQEWAELMKSDPSEVKFIRTAEDWTRAIGVPLTSADHPLRGCRAEMIEAFTKELVFDRGGLAGANWAVVADQLTYRQFADLWARFGLGMKLFLGYQHYKCESRATCVGSWEHICTSNCRS